MSLYIHQNKNKKHTASRVKPNVSYKHWVLIHYHNKCASQVQDVDVGKVVSVMAVGGLWQLDFLLKPDYIISLDLNPRIVSSILGK